LPGPFAATGKEETRGKGKRGQEGKENKKKKESGRWRGEKPSK